MKRNNHPGKMIRILLLCLCAMLAMGCAFAEETETVNFGGDGRNLLYYGTTLADGRILIVGSRITSGEERYSGRLLCLNRDRTVSWEYNDDDYREGIFFRAAELEDGTIGLVFRPVTEDKHSGCVLRFFTADGKPTGKEVRIPCRKDEVLIKSVTKSRLQVLDVNELTEEGENQTYSVHYDNYLIDWDGNEIAFLEDFDLGTADNDMIEEADGLVMNGYVIYDSNMRKVVRKTDLKGNLIWETKLETVWPDTTRADAERIIPAGDGGYIVLQTEPVKPEGDIEYEYRGALVKLDHEGNVIRTDTEGFKGFTDRGERLAMAGGRIAASFINIGTDGKSYTPDNPRRIAWFDENGKFLGNVEMKFGTESFPRLRQDVGTTAGGAEKILRFFEDRLIPMEDGLWMSGQFQKARNELMLFDTGLFKVPEP